MTIGWIDSTDFDLHTNGPRHPERPERLHAIRAGLAQRNLESRLQRTAAPEVERQLLEQIHEPRYVAALQATCQAGGGSLDPDTAVVAASWTAALQAAGAVVHATEQVLAGVWKRAFCSVRPPGHHAPADRAMGFCLFDNVALGAQAARAVPGIERVAILDWDVHHGNGTEAIFWERPDVLYASWHQYPFYPGTGARSDVGAGAGRGTTVNCPIAAGDGDTAYWQAWDERIRPALEAFAPDMLFISAGFDADGRDTMAELEVTAAGFTQLSEAVVRWADAQCQGRVVSVLEGGYNLQALAEDVALHVETLL